MSLIQKPSNTQIVAAVAGAVGAIGYAGTWISASAFGTNLSAAPLGNSGWATTWFVALLVGAVLALGNFVGNKVVLGVAAVGSAVFTINLLVNYYQLPSLDRAFLSLSWGVFATALGTLVALVTVLFDSYKEINAA